MQLVIYGVHYTCTLLHWLSDWFIDNNGRTSELNAVLMSLQMNGECLYYWICLIGLINIVVVQYQYPETLMFNCYPQQVKHIRW